MPASENLGDGFSERLRLGIRDWRVQRHVDMQTLRASALHEALQFQFLKQVVQPNSHTRRIQNTRRLPRVEVEDYKIRPTYFRPTREKRVHFDIGELSCPNDRWKIVDQYEMDF